MNAGAYLYAEVSVLGPDGDGVYHYCASRRLIERITDSTITLAPPEFIEWTCQTPPLQDWQPETHPAWNKQRRIRLTEGSRTHVHIDAEGWYSTEAPAIPQEQANPTIAVKQRIRAAVREFHERQKPNPEATP